MRQCARVGCGKLISDETIKKNPHAKYCSNECYRADAKEKQVYLRRYPGKK